MTNIIISKVLGRSFESRADYMKAWKKAFWTEYYRNWRKRNKLADGARNRLTDAIYRKLIIRPDSCESCGNVGSVQGHHHDYSKPLDVIWLCHQCHVSVHLQIKAINKHRTKL